MIDNKTIEQARNADIIAFLKSRYGFTFSHHGGAYRCQQHQSLAVKADRRSFYWHSKGVGGFGVLDYLTKVENMSFRDAVEAVTGACFATLSTTLTSPTKEQPKTLILPEKSGLQLRLYDYLHNKRGIDSEIIHTLIQKEMLYEDRRGNVVFVGYDEHNKARFASLRGTQSDFRGDCAGSDKRYGFSVSAYIPSERLYLYESPIDLMSHSSLENYLPFDEDAWQEHHRLSLAGVTDTAIPFFLNKHTEVKELVFCLDNDHAGREAAVNMARKYAEKGYRTCLDFPQNKDYNEDLLTIISKKPQKYKLINDICL